MSGRAQNGRGERPTSAPIWWEQQCLGQESHLYDFEMTGAHTALLPVITKQQPREGPP